MTHKEKVLHLLRDGEPHSHMDGYRLGVMLHSRVSDLRRDGHDIRCWREGDQYLYQLAGDGQPRPSAPDRSAESEGAPDEPAPPPCLDRGAGSTFLGRPLMASWVESEAVEGYERAHPKPAKRHRATKKEWERIRECFNDACCVHCGLAHQHLHHVAFKSEGGGDLIENLAPLCLTHHTIFHAHSDGWRQVAASIRQYVLSNPHRRQYAENALGHRFEQRYPAIRVCPNLNCELMDGHSGVHADLADECFQPRHTDDYLEPDKWEATT